MIYTYYINRNGDNIKQIFETEKPTNPSKEEVSKFIFDNYSQEKNFDLIKKYLNSKEIIFRGVSPKTKLRKTVSNDKSFHYYSTSPIIAAGYTQWDKYRFTFGFLDESEEYKTQREFVNPKELELFCQQVLGEKQYINTLTNDFVKTNLYGLKPKINECKQNQVVAEENCTFVDLHLSLICGKIFKYQLKNMFNIYGNYYKI